MQLSTTRRSIVLFLILAFSPWSCPSIVQADVETGVVGFRSTIGPFLREHCLDCHGTDQSRGDTTLDSLTGEFASNNEPELWERVLEQLASGEMPPEEADQPTDADRKRVIEWIESGLRDFIRAQPSDAVVPAVRRLTNVEYQNVLRDLLGFELDVMNDLPSDPERFYHFSNTADLMRMGPEQLDRYLQIARRAMQSAIVDPEKPEVYRVRKQWSSAGNDRGLGYDEVGVWGNRRNSAADGVGIKGFPKTGQFRLRIQASAILPPGFKEVPLQLDLGTPPGRTETPFKTVATLYLSNSPDDPAVFEFTGRIENHPYAPTRVGKRGDLVDQMSIRPRVVFDDGTLNDGGTYAKVRQLSLPRAVIQWIEFEAPIVDVWPPEHHTAILFDSTLRETDADMYVREVLSRFMTRAYRRPVRESEIDRYRKIYRLVRPSVSSLEAAIRETLAMVLVSPPFLYRAESDPEMDSQFELASRLSFFLWASMPDQELFELAASKQLAQPSVIEHQVTRMLADEKSQSFVRDFTLQWLNIEKMLTVPINQDLYPRFLYRVPNGETAGTEVPYRPTVRDYMMEETIGFVEEIIRRNASVLSIVDSDFAYLNQRLAAHYGVDDVDGMRMRPVSINRDQHLGGLLTHGSVLIGNGTGTAPHPIYRAVWLREAILGDTVQPPPSEVPALTDTAGESVEEALSIAELLAKHRTKASCNDCHARLDPWGIPFERYNAIGKYQPFVPKDGVRVRGFNEKTDQNLNGYANYRASINEVEVAATARVPNGPKVDGIRDLKDYLIDHRSDDIAKNVIRRLLSYAVGRELSYRDRFDVEDLFDQANNNGFKIRDILISICQCHVFRDTD